jgi:hypothetical protein
MAEVLKLKQNECRCFTDIFRSTSFKFMYVLSIVNEKVSAVSFLCDLQEMHEISA